MLKLRQVCMARPTCGCYNVVGQVIYDSTRDGKGGCSVKTSLHAAVMAYIMGVVPDPVPEQFGKAFDPAQWLEQPSLQDCGSFEALHITAHRATSAGGS